MDNNLFNLKVALQNGNLYDFISQEGRNFSKQQLIDIIKELDYTIYEFNEEVQKDIEAKTLLNLEDREFFSD